MQPYCRTTCRRVGILLLFLPTQSFSQHPAQCPSGGLGRVTFRRLINAQFAGIVNPRFGGGLGTFGAYEAKDGTLSFAGSHVTRGNSIWTVKVSGSGADGLLPIIDSTKVNTTFAAELQLHRLADKGQRIEYLLESCQRYFAAVQAAEARETLDTAGFAGAGSRLAAAVRVRESADRNKLIAELQITADSLKRLRVNEPSSTRKAWLDARVEELRLRRDSVDAEIEAGKVSDAADREAVGKGVSNIDKLAAHNVFVTAVDNAESELRITGFRFSWWTFAIGVWNNKFKNFDASASFDAQLVARQYVTREATVERSWVRSDTLGRTALRFITLGGSASLSDNFADLSPLTLTEKVQYSPVDDRRSSTKTVKAAAGEYRSGLQTGRLYANLYSFTRAGNTIGVHLFPEVLLQKGSRTRANFGVGLIALAKSPDKATTRVNIEPYWLLVDLSNGRNTISSVIAASQFGFRFTVPLAFQPPE